VVSISYSLDTFPGPLTAALYLYHYYFSILFECLDSWAFCSYEVSVKSETLVGFFAQ